MHFTILGCRPALIYFLFLIWGVCGGQCHPLVCWGSRGWCTPTGSHWSGRLVTLWVWSFTLWSQCEKGGWYSSYGRILWLISDYRLNYFHLSSSSKRCTWYCLTFILLWVYIFKYYSVYLFIFICTSCTILFHSFCSSSTGREYVIDSIC